MLVVGYFTVHLLTIAVEQLSGIIVGRYVCYCLVLNSAWSPSGSLRTWHRQLTFLLRTRQLTSTRPMVSLYSQGVLRWVKIES